MEINVVDTVDSWLVEEMLSLKNLGHKVVDILTGDHAVRRMVDEIIRLAGSPSSITVLNKPSSIFPTLAKVQLRVIAYPVVTVSSSVTIHPLGNRPALSNAGLQSRGRRMK